MVLLVFLSACSHLGIPGWFLPGEPKEGDLVPAPETTVVSPVKEAAQDSMPTAEPAKEAEAVRLDFSPERIRELEMITEGSPSQRTRAEAHYLLGWIFVYESNPKRDYARALKEFELYLSMVPEENVRVDARSWVKLLTELQRQREEAAKLKERSEQLEKRKQEMEHDIEKLKDLDLWLEDQKQDRR